ncbi:hypothetical protein LINPERHAP1_LOCUS36815 [Linum perenne]
MCTRSWLKDEYERDPAVEKTFWSWRDASQLWIFFLGVMMIQSI